MNTASTPTRSSRIVRSPFALVALCGLLSLGIACLAGADQTEDQSGALAGAGVSATLSAQSDWGTGYCDLVTVTNTGAAITGWQVVVALNSTYAQSWNATVTVAGGQLDATSLDWNGALAPNASTSFGFCGTASGATARPTLTSVSATRAGGTGTGGGTGTTTGGSPGTGTGGAKGGSTGTGGIVGTGGFVGTGGSTGTGGGAAGNSNPSGLPAPPGAANLPRPSGAPGAVTVLNWAGFKGAVSYTLDDDNDSQIANYGSLEALGVPFTFYMWASRTEASNTVWAEAVKDGHEIGNHTWSHQSVPPGGAQDINQATTFIMQHLGVTPYTMAAPNGAAVYTGLANGLFMINRGVSDAIVRPNDDTDRFTLPCYIPPTGGTASANFNPEVDAAQAAGGWRIILVHGFTGGNDGAYQPVPLAEYENGIKHTIALGNMWIGRVVDVGAYWLGQKAFSAATTMTSGNTKTWTWTKPSNYAPGKYLRITVPGGTVSQKGVALPWNSHGYYEISMDVGSVTVGP